jgi:hypothetical protein
MASEKAFSVFRSRAPHLASGDTVQSMIKDAYATVSLALRRAAASYTKDPELQRLGTETVHLVSVATSHMARAPL